MFSVFNYYFFSYIDVEWCIPEMEEIIQSNHMDVDKEEARPNPEVASLPQERHIWRMPELPPIPQGLHPQTLM